MTTFWDRFSAQKTPTPQNDSHPSTIRPSHDSETLAELDLERLKILNAEFQRVDGRGLLSKDPKDTLTTQNKTTALTKHLTMAQSPFRFFRGSASLFYADLSTARLSLPEAFTALPFTRIQGDCHFSNFGFLTEEGSHGDDLVWALNDFDDACVGHAAWDLLRFATSLFLVTDTCQGFKKRRYPNDLPAEKKQYAPTKKGAQAAVLRFLEAYSHSCDEMIGDPDRRNQKLESFKQTHFLYRFWKKAGKRQLGGKDFEQKSSLGKATLCFEGQLRFRPLPDRFMRLSPQQEKEIRTAFRPYVDDEILDLVQRQGAGTGSLDIDRYYLLVGPAQPDLKDWSQMAHLVEVKQQKPAAALYHFPSLSPVNRLNPAHLTVDCQRLMQRRPDLVLDEAFWREKSWLVRSRHHARLGLDPEDLMTHPDPNKALQHYAKACGKVLAQAHARGDRRSTRFETQMVQALEKSAMELADLAEIYAKNVKKDWQLFKTVFA